MGKKVEFILYLKFESFFEKNQSYRLLEVEGDPDLSRR